MRTLIIPDVHEQIDALLELAPAIDEAERIVCLGDFFDTHGERNAASVARWIKERLDDNRFTWLLGNHDCHYFFRHQHFKCSGYNPMTADVVLRNFTREDILQFKPYTQVGPYLVSHAGFRPETEYLATAQHAEEAVDKAIRGSFHDMWTPGYARGGWAMYGGPTWLDFNQEFLPIPGRPQIVGHTFSRKHTVQSKDDAQGNRSYCLDTGLRHIAWWDGELRIERIKKEKEQVA